LIVSNSLGLAPLYLFDQRYLFNQEAVFGLSHHLHGFLEDLFDSDVQVILFGKSPDGIVVM
jgi:hypothetical protein